MCSRGKKDIYYQSFIVVPWCTDAAWHRCTLQFQSRVDQHEKDSVIALNAAEITGGGWHLVYNAEAVLTPLRQLNKNISSCFSAHILFQAEQKPVAIRHAKPEIKSLLLSVTLGEARVLVKYPRLPCPLSVAIWACPASYITPVPVTTWLSAFSFLVFEV